MNLFNNNTIRSILFFLIVLVSGYTIADNGIGKYSYRVISTYSDLGVLPPHSTLIDKKLGDWGGEWWKWAFSFDKSISPISDTTGNLCRLGQDQNNDVWFLAGSYSTKPIVRECIIPEGKALFFPVINFIYYSPKNKTSTCAEVTNLVKKRTQIPFNLFVRINDEELKDPYLHREPSSTCFDPFEGKNSKTKHSWAYPAASNGYWVAIEPLPVGTHVLQFGGNLPKFRQNITYKLHVVPITNKNNNGSIESEHYKI
jgi:hypothetical protein